MAIDLVEAGFAQPAQLLLEAGKAIARIVLDAADLTAEALVDPRRSRADQVEVGEDPARREQRLDFAEQLALALVL